MNQRQWYERVSEIIPWGTQTGAKRHRPGLDQEMPYYIKSGKGCKFVDMEDREYTDYLCALGPIILGHAFEPVDEAVKEEMDRGFLFSAASVKEYELAKKLVSLIPSLDWVRFLKTGGDATSAAVRLARSLTGKMKVVHYGYHGWHDWYAASTGLVGAKGGVPRKLLDMIVSLPYNDLAQFEKIASSDANIAALILTPYDWVNEPAPGFLKGIRDICTEKGIVLIFDEVLSGFRLGLLGAQGEFGVEPDLTVFAKAISNGYPLSVVGGKKWTKEAWNHTSVTTTYAGETLSIAAALATIEVIEREDVFSHLNRVGGQLMAGLRQLIDLHHLPAKVVGRPALSKLFFIDADPTRNQALTFRLMQFYMKNRLFIKEHDGISYYLNYSHSEEDIRHVLDVTESAFIALRNEEGFF